MNGQIGKTGVAAVGVWMSLGWALAQTPPAGEGSATVSQAKGTFEVKLTPIAEKETGTVASGRLTFDKTFQGDLQGSSRGEMWTTDTSVEGSAGYVAIEKVDGTLLGRSGHFTLLHRGTMRRGGDFDMNVVVVPDSGTGALAGLTGKMAIVVADGKHSYRFDYTIPDTR